MKKALVALIVAVVIILAYIAVGHADDGKVNVSVDDITAVYAQLSDMDGEIIMLAKLIHSEAGIVQSQMEQAAVVWCVLNRVDAGHRGRTIKEVITSPHQFAWNPNETYTDELYSLARDVVTRWLLEKRGVEDVGRVLPKEYLYFAGRGGHNWFRTLYRGGVVWDWECVNPYE